jgi:hypothetical protein
VTVLELQIAAVEEFTVEQAIVIEAKLNPSWTEQDSEVLRQRRENELAELHEALKEARERASGQR